MMDYYSTEIRASKRTSNATLQKSRIEKIRLDHSATTIQASWRGFKYRRICQRISPVAGTPPYRTKPLATASRGEIRYLQSSKDVQNDFNNDDDDDGYTGTKDDIDPEEEIAVTAAEHLGEGLINGAGDNQSQALWPPPLSENLDDPSSPNLESAASLSNVLGSKKVRIRVITWNLCAKKPPSADMCRKKLFPLNKFHLYIIGSEECERSIAQSAVNTSKKAWEAFLSEVVGPMYVPLRSHTLQAIHVIAFAHKSISSLCSDIASAAVATGMGNTLGNKGAVAISLRIGRTKFLFANAHLAAHQNAVKQRNNDYSKIAKEMPLLLLKSEMKTKARLEFRINKANNANSVTRSKHSTSNAGDSIPTISTGQGFSMPYDDNSPRNDPGGLDDPAFVPELEDFANRVVFMGDLNYRVRGNRSVVSKLLAMDMHEVMLGNDQLISCMQKDLVLKGFTEPPLNFRPTYKLDTNSDEYDTGSKKRIPAWTDRVLYVKSEGFRCTAYDSDPSLRTSDHRPVFASFISTIELNSADRNDEVDSNYTDKADGAHPVFSSETQVCSIM